MTLKLDGTGSITGIDQGLNVVGVVTYSTDLNVGGDLNVTGDLNVAGVLTYDDVTNIDSIGVVTARSGVHVGTEASGTLINGNSNGIGIGTNNPQKKLTVADFEGSTDTELIRITQGVDPGTQQEFGIGFAANINHTHPAAQITYEEHDASDSRGHLIFYTRGDNSDSAPSERLRITSVGHVGIGTDVVDSRLTLAAPSATARLELRRTNAAGSGSYGAINFTALDGHSVASIHAKGDGDGDDDGGDIVFRTTSAATSNDPYTITERVRIASDGRIGLSGENYGTDNQVLTSQGTGVPEWRGVNAAFYGRQDAAHNITHATWNTVKNFASDVVNTITGWDESTGIFTANADTAGTYYVFGSAGIDDVQSLDVMRVGICKNNETPGAFVEYRSYSGSANQITGGIMVARVVTLANGDNVRMKVYHNEGSTEPTEPNRTFFGGFRLSV